MASNRNLKSDDIDGFMLATWDSWADLEYDFGVSIEIRMNPRSPRGHFKWEAVAKQASDEPLGRVVAVAEAIWPTHYAKAPHSLLYALLVRLWRELDAWKERTEGGDSSPSS